MTTVSVVIAVYNGERFIAESLRSALRQTVAPIECIVVDGASIDRTAAAVTALDDPRIKLVPQVGAGPSAARNQGIALAGGDVIAFLDADDVWHPQKLELQLRVLELRPELGLIGCSYAILDADLRELTRVAAEDQDLHRWLLLEGNGFAVTSTGLAPRRVLEEVGGFDPRLPYSGDLDLALRIADRHPLIALDEALVGYRSHPAQLHHDAFAYERDVLIILDRHVTGARERRRALANLHTRLCYHDARRGRWGLALRRLARVAPRADRFVLLPAEALVRRRRRRRRKRQQHAQSWATFGR